MKSNLIFTVLILGFVVYSCSPKKTENEQKTISEYERAYYYLEKNQSDSAFIYFNQAKDSFKEKNDSLNVANCYIQMSIILYNAGDYYGTQEFASEAQRHLNLKDSSHFVYVSSNYNVLGQATFRLSNTIKSIEFYEQAIQYSIDSQHKRVYLNNMARAFQAAHNFEKAIEIYSQILKDIPDENSLDYARTLTNLSVSKWKSDPSYKAELDLKKALKIREKQHDLIGQNSSYAHLSDYYTFINKDSALYFSQKRYHFAKKMFSVDDQIASLEKLLLLGPADSAKRYFSQFKKLSDSVQFARLNAKNQFALIRFEVEKNKAENLRLEKDNLEKENKVFRHRIGTIGTVSISMVLLVGGLAWYKRRNKKLLIETQNQIKENQLKTSRKVHDIVANGIYRVMTEIEHRDDLDREGILDRLENMYEKSRDISYDTDVYTPKELDFVNSFSILLRSFAHEERRVVIVGNDAVLWDSVSKIIYSDLEQVLQEMMINMNKHSFANEVIIHFKREKNVLSIYYHDNGIGMENFENFGNGLKSAVNRIHNLNGNIIFGNRKEEGCSIEIHIPIK